MISIKKDRCGYKGYTCVGAPKLSNDMQPRKLVCDDELARVSDFVVMKADDDTVIDFSYIDNYKNLPEKIRGFAMSVDIILDMSGVSAPETACKTDMDAFGDGLLDLYSAFSSKVVYSYGSGYVLAKDYLLCAEDSFLHPALLEPILDTEFPPPTIDIPPVFDPIADGIYVILATILNWMCVVEYKINDLYKIVKEVYGLRNLLISFATNKCTECNGFSITLTDGKAFKKGGTPSGEYTVSGGYVTVNGQTVYVEGETGDAPFYAYAVIPLYESEDGVYEADDGWIELTSGGAPSGSEDEIVIGIGSVRLVKSSQGKGHGSFVSGKNIPTFNMFVVEQEECIPNVEVVRTPEEGFLYRMGGGTVPYKAYEYEECPEMDDGEEEPDDGL